MGVLTLRKRPEVFASKLPSLGNGPHLAAVLATEVDETLRQRGRLRNLRVALRALLAAHLWERGWVCHVRHREACESTGTAASGDGRPHFRRSRASHTSPHCVQRKDTKWAVNVAISATVAEHSGHGSTLRPGSAPGNWIMVSGTVTQARLFSNDTDVRMALIRKHHGAGSATLST